MPNNITPEMVEAGLRITLSSVGLPAGECLHATDVQEILSAALAAVEPVAEQLTQSRFKSPLTDAARRQVHKEMAPLRDMILRSSEPAPPPEIPAGLDAAQEAANLQAVIDYMEQTNARKFDPSRIVTLVSLVKNRLERAAAPSATEASE